MGEPESTARLKVLRNACTAALNNYQNVAKQACERMASLSAPITFQQSIELIKWGKKEAFARDAYISARDALLSYLISIYCEPSSAMPLQQFESEAD